MATKRTCSLDGCDRLHYARGWCHMHYQRWKKHDDPALVLMHRAPVQHWLKVMVGSDVADDQCVLWPFALNGPGGYPVVLYKGRQVTAGTAVLNMSGIPAPSGSHEVAHAPLVCHERRCVNPHHLRWATRAENHADKRLDGTHLEGEKVAGSKLSAEEVLQIRSDSRTQSKIAADYGVEPATISMIKRRVNWKHL